MQRSVRAMVLALACLAIAAPETGCRDAGDDDSATPPDEDPCGTVYRPVSPISGEEPVAAERTDEGVGADPAPRRVRLGFHDDPSTSLTVLWETDVDTTASIIEWGDAGAALDRSRVAYTFTLTDGDDEVRLHEARLCDLAPDTSYDVRVGSPGAMSETLTFTTDGPARSHVTLVALGDSRGGYDVLDQLMELSSTPTPVATIHTGDYLYLANDLEEWGRYFDASIPELTISPLIPVHGNHELFLDSYFGMVAAPGNEQWYSLDLGPVHIAVINDSCDDASIAAQAAWLDDDLAASTAAFDIVVTHRPPYSSGHHGSTATLQELLVPVVDAHHVDLVLSGHDHGYERTHPLYGGEVVGSTAEGTVYVVTAGAGADLYGVDGDVFTAYAESAYHVCRLEIGETLLRLEAIRLDGTTMDSVEIPVEPGTRPVPTASRAAGPR